MERPAKVVEPLLVLDRSVSAVGDKAHRSCVLGVGFERDLTRAPRPAELVDAGVLGDLVNPGLEGDRALGRAQAA